MESEFLFEFLPLIKKQKKKTIDNLAELLVDTIEELLSKGYKLKEEQQ